jgi:hypothetical protein
MKRKRNFKTTLFLWLRRQGALCKKPVYKKPVIKIAKTVYPDGHVKDEFPDGKPRLSPNGSGEWYGLVGEKTKSDTTK